MRCLFAYRPYRLDFRVPLRTAQGLWTQRAGVIVRLESEQGRVGWGEAAPVPGFGMESAQAVEEACRALNGEISDETLRQLPAALPTLINAVTRGWSALPSTRSAPGPSSGRNAAGGQGAREAARSTPIAALLPAGAACLAIARAKAGDGFRTFKWKVGAGDPGDELAILDDLCAVLPAGGKLRLDANGAWDRRVAERWLGRCAERPIEFLEQPIAREARGADDLLLGLAGDFPTPLALDESLVAEGDLERWLGAGWPGVFIFKPSLFADPAKAAARLARAGAPVVFSSALETAIGARAALELAFAWPGERKALGFGVWPLFVNSTCDGPATAPFLHAADVERLDPETVWTALG